MWRIMMAVAVMTAGLAGCTDPIKEAVLQSKTVMMAIVDKAKIDQSNLSASADVANPEYRFEFVAGTGIHASGRLQLVGVQAHASATGGGTGQNPVDEELRNMLYQTLNRGDIGSEQRKNKIVDIVQSYFVKAPEATTRTSP